MEKAVEEIWGLVETFHERELTGWVNLAEGEEYREVCLCVNGKQVQKIRTAGPIERDLPFSVHRFSLRMGSLWHYVSPSDKISIKVNDHNLHIAGHGREYSPTIAGELPTSTLFTKLEQKWVFNQKGSLQLSKTVDLKWQKRTFSLYNMVREHLKTVFSVDLVVIYGTLLGAVRSGQFIGHDHDFDCGFISKFSVPQEVRQEAILIAENLVSSGFQITVKPSCIYVRHPSIPRAQIDIGRIFLGPDGKLQTAFGFAGTTEYTAEHFKGVETISLAGSTVYTVSNPEVLLSCIYGNEWRIPNSGFNWDRERRRITRAARLTKAEILSIAEFVEKQASAKANELSQESSPDAEVKD